MIKAISGMKEYVGERGVVKPLLRIRHMQENKHWRDEHWSHAGFRRLISIPLDNKKLMYVDKHIPQPYKQDHNIP